MDYKSLLGPQDFSSPGKIAEWINDATAAISDLLSCIESMEAEKQKLCEEADHLKDLLKEAESERDAAVKDLRQMCVGGNTCAFCVQDRKCGKAGPGRKTVETCWECRGPQAGC